MLVTRIKQHVSLRRKNKKENLAICTRESSLSAYSKANKGLYTVGVRSAPDSRHEGEGKMKMSTESPRVRPGITVSSSVLSFKTEERGRGGEPD